MRTDPARPLASEHPHLMRTKQFPAVPATTDTAANRTTRRLRLPAHGRRPAILLATAAAGAIVVTTVVGNQPAAEAETETVTASVSVAEQLGISKIGRAHV